MMWSNGDLKVNSTGAEYTETSMDESLKKQQVHERIPDMIRQSIEKGRKYRIVFVKNVTDAIFLSTKIPDSACVHAGTKKKDRTRILDDFRAGKIKTVFNVGVLTIGFDFPALDTIIVARPTMSLALFMQMVGRGIRLHPGKQDCAVVDMCGNLERFGKIEEIKYLEEPGRGWIIHNGKRQLSGVPLNKK
jgi:DNA repair protein RadD